jgi:hypothetical protein
MCINCSSSETIQPDYSWKEEGFALQYPGKENSKQVEYAVVRLARRFGQVAVVRLMPHRFGAVQSLHTSVIQTIVPTGSSMNLLISEGPAYQVNDQPAGEVDPYT